MENKGIKSTSKYKSSSLEELVKISYKIGIPEILKYIQEIMTILSKNAWMELADCSDDNLIKKYPHIDVIGNNFTVLLMAFIVNLDKIEKQDSIDFIDAFCNAIKCNVINETHIRFTRKFQRFTEMIGENINDGK